ncbi:MAG: hypothetical protein ACR2J8_01110, partial [Thermomicrobiales bacterium]
MNVKLGRVAVMSLMAAGMLFPMGSMGGFAQGEFYARAQAGENHGYVQGRSDERRSDRKDITDGDFALSCDVVNGACSGEVLVGFKAGKGP